MCDSRGREAKARHTHTQCRVAETNAINGMHVRHPSDLTAAPTCRCLAAARVIPAACLKLPGVISKEERTKENQKKKKSDGPKGDGNGRNRVDARNGKKREKRRIDIKMQRN